MRSAPRRRTPSSEATPKGVRGFPVGDTPEARGELAQQPTCPRLDARESGTHAREAASSRRRILTH